MLMDHARARAYPHVCAWAGPARTPAGPGRHVRACAIPSRLVLYSAAHDALRHCAGARGRHACSDAHAEQLGEGVLARHQAVGLLFLATDTSMPHWGARGTRDAISMYAGAARLPLRAGLLLASAGNKRGLEARSWRLLRAFSTSLVDLSADRASATNLQRQAVQDVPIHRKADQQRADVASGR
jgi:hypothetical protein